MATRVLEYISDINGSCEQYLKSLGYSTRICKQLKKQLGLVTINDEPSFVVAPVRIGDRIIVRLVENPTPIQPLDKFVNIVYEDMDLAIIDKTPDIAVIGNNAHYNKSLINALANVWGDFVFHPVNRLDCGTSGLMIVAKNGLTHKLLSETLQLDKTSDVKAVGREYTAIVHNDGSQMVGSGTVIADIGMMPTGSMARCVLSDGGKYAKTHYAVLEACEQFSVVKLVLATGRTHQIRAHMEHIGHPVFNDERYGGDRILRGTTYTKYKQFVNNCFKIMPRHGLHAISLGFVHPKTKEKMEFVSEYPNDFKECLEKWKSYISTR